MPTLRRLSQVAIGRVSGSRAIAWVPPVHPTLERRAQVRRAEPDDVAQQLATQGIDRSCAAARQSA